MWNIDMNNTPTLCLEQNKTNEKRRFTVWDFGITRSRSGRLGAVAAQGMTDEEISIMEKEGYDMSPVRAKKTELAAQDQA